MGNQQPILPPGRLLSDDQIKTAIQGEQFYFEVLRYYDRDFSVISISSQADLDRAIAMATQFSSTPKTLFQSHVWLMVPVVWSESLAMPTSLVDMARIKELFVGMNDVDKSAPDVSQF